MELEDQIKKLQEEKSKIYSEERTSALSDIKGKIALFQFSAKELGFKLPKVASDKAVKADKTVGKKAGKKAAKKAPKKPAKAPAKSSRKATAKPARKAAAKKAAPARRRAVKATPAAEA
jgi:hypothetical protein